MSFIKLVVSGIPPDSRLPGQQSEAKRINFRNVRREILRLVLSPVKLFILTLDAFLVVGCDVWLCALAIFLRNALIFLPLWKIKNGTVTKVSRHEKA